MPYRRGATCKICKCFAISFSNYTIKKRVTLSFLWFCIIRFLIELWTDLWQVNPQENAGVLYIPYKIFFIQNILHAYCKVNKRTKLVKEFDHCTYVKFGYHSKIRGETMDFFSLPQVLFSERHESFCFLSLLWVQ